MISHRHQCIFIHIPKCAGTSIETALGHFDGHVGRGGQDHRSMRMIQQPAMSAHTFLDRDNLKDYIRRIRYNYRAHSNKNNCLKVTASQYQTYFKFSIVRNPWGRAYSWYKNAMRDEIHRKSLHIRDQLSFHNFIEKFAGKGMLRPQTYWLKNYTGEINLDFIGNFETLHQDFEFVCRKLGMPDLALPHRIAGDGYEYRKHIEARTVNLIGDIYREEISLFEYQF